MDTDELRDALTAEIDRATAALGGPESWTAEQAENRERLLGYRQGVEFALGLIAPAPTAPAHAEETVPPDPAHVLAPEPELVDQLTRVRNTEV